MRVPKKKLPVYPRKKPARIGNREAQRIKSLKVWREQAAERLGLEAGLMFNKTLVNDVARRNPAKASDLKEIEGMRNWQRRVLGDDILKVLRKG